jgi:phosphomannomutase
MPEIYKSYDIRGIYPEDINEDIVYKIGRAIPLYFGEGDIAVASDNRASSPVLTYALQNGICDSGANVIKLGHLSTPMLYFASAKLDVAGAVMVTASHNPPQYNGLKICKKNAVPVGLSSGLTDIKALVEKGEFLDPKHRGTIVVHNIKKEYDEFFAAFADLEGKRFRVATDTAHAMGVLELPVLRRVKGLCLCATLYNTLMPPGTCRHDANPADAETLVELQDVLRFVKADIGIAYDGDADRIGFVDELGRTVPMDLVTALLAKALLPKFSGGTVLYDLRSSRAVKEAIESAGGIANECKVGHANIKKQMHDEGAILAGEASGHYYFSFGGYIAEMGSLPAILILNLMAQSGKALSELVDELMRYHHSGELNFRVEDAAQLFEKVRNEYSDGALTTLDGIKISYPDWWFSLRSSNTEPLVRLNLEAKTSEMLEEKKRALLSLITGSQR